MYFLSRRLTDNLKLLLRAIRENILLWCSIKNLRFPNWKWKLTSLSRKWKDFLVRSKVGQYDGVVELYYVKPFGKSGLQWLYSASSLQQDYTFLTYTHCRNNSKSILTFTVNFECELVDDGPTKPPKFRDNSVTFTNSPPCLVSFVVLVHQLKLSNNMKI